jgi:hypothetical protein
LRGYSSNVGACSWDLCILQLHCRGLFHVRRVVSSSMPHVHSIRDAKACSASIIASVKTVHLVHTCGHESIAALNASDGTPDENKLCATTVRDQDLLFFE